MEFRDKVAVVTGGTSGIGLETVLRLAQQGAIGVAIGLAEEDLPKVAEERGVSLDFFRADVAEPGDVIALASMLQERYGRVDCLVNAAGVQIFGSALDTNLADWNSSLAVNLTGPFLVAQALLPLMTGGGSIVNISSVVALVAGKRRLPYAAAKSGLLGMTRAMALDHAEDGIRVNAVCPGAVETPMLHKAWSTVGSGQTADSMRAALEQVTPLGRVGTVADIAELILFLCGPHSSFITGATFTIDGGITAQLAASQAR